ncbi:restriction endonuclease [Xanthomonas oryzae]|uniref:restriction endonuclease n=1 Tax=Xanthomonas oryzae TaxID=347 RepID=UPI0034E05CC5
MGNAAGPTDGSHRQSGHRLECLTGGHHVLVTTVCSFRRAGDFRYAILAFADLLEARGSRGIFIHTGRTGAGARELATANPHLTIISGQRLLDFLNSGRLDRENANAHRTMGN